MCKTMRKSPTKYSDEFKFMLTFKGLQATTHIDARPIMNYALRSMNQPEMNYEPTRS